MKLMLLFVCTVAFSLSASAKKVTLEVQEILKYKEAKAYSDGSVKVKQPKMYGYPVDATPAIAFNQANRVCSSMGLKAVSYTKKQQNGYEDGPDVVVLRNEGFIIDKAFVVLETVTCFPKGTESEESTCE